MLDPQLTQHGGILYTPLIYLLIAPGCALEVLTGWPRGVGLQLLRRYASRAAASRLLLLVLLPLLLLLLLLLFLLFVRAAPVRFVHLRMRRERVNIDT